MIEWKAFELHTHTCHSDGQFTPEKLCYQAAENLYDGIAITDHNTMSAFGEIDKDLERKTVAVIRGIEWTTFYGHMLVLGAEKYIDWRFYKPDNIDEAINLIKESNGVVGIAHPFAMGNPICTGCRWEFNIENWDNVDYIEVWSESWPLVQLHNTFAFRLWTDLLNKGFRLSATSGRDWHSNDNPQKHYAVTYLGVDGSELNHWTALQAIRNGRTYVTAGPQLDFNVIGEGKTAYPGDTVRRGYIQMCLQAKVEHRKEIWGGYGISPKYFKLIENGNEIYRCNASEGQSIEVRLPVQKGWIRAELYGEYMGFNDMMIAFTSPVYIE